jgi:hypothetical protein
MESTMFFTKNKNIQTLAFTLVILSLLAACSGKNAGPDENVSATTTAIAATAFSVAYTEAAIQAQVPAATQPPSEAPADDPGAPAAQPVEGAEPDAAAQPVQTVQAEEAVQPVQLPVASQAGETYFWQTQVLDTPSVGPHVALTTDSGNIPHIVYFDDANDNLKYATVKEGSWRLQSMDSPNADGLYGSIVVDGADNPHTVRYILSAKYITYMYYTGSTWDPAAFIADVNVGGTSIAMDSTQTVHLAYFDKFTNELRYAVVSGNAFVTQVIGNGTPDGGSFPLVLGADDAPHIAYYDANQGLLYVSNEGGSWVAQVVDGGANVGLNPDMVIDRSGKTHLSYVDNATQTLKHAIFDGTAWQVEAVDSGAFGATAIAAGPQGSIHMSYYDIATGTLKHAYLPEGGQWSINIVAQGGDDGSFNDISVDSAGTPHIAFYDAGGEQLKYGTGVRQ